MDYLISLLKQNCLFACRIFILFPFWEGAWHGGFDSGPHLLQAETKGSMHVSVTRVCSVLYQALFSSVCKWKVSPWSLGQCELTGEMSVSDQNGVTSAIHGAWSQPFPTNCSKVGSSHSEIHIMLLSGAGLRQAIPQPT